MCWELRKSLILPSTILQPPAYQSEMFHKCMPQRKPSYMAVMLNMTDLADGLTFHSYNFIPFHLYNQTVAIALSADPLWHISCDVPFQQNIHSNVLSAECEL